MKISNYLFLVLLISGFLSQQVYSQGEETETCIAPMDP